MSAAAIIAEATVFAIGAVAGIVVYDPSRRAARYGKPVRLGIVQLRDDAKPLPDVPAARRLSAVDLGRVLAAVAAYYGVDPQSFRILRDESISRDVAAWLARQLTSCTLRELAAEFGLGHADSVRNLTRRIERALEESSKLRHDIARIRGELHETKRI